MIPGTSAALLSPTKSFQRRFFQRKIILIKTLESTRYPGKENVKFTEYNDQLSAAWAKKELEKEKREEYQKNGNKSYKKNI